MSLKVPVLSLSATLVMCCWLQSVHAFSSDDATFIFPQIGVNQSLVPPKEHRAISQLYGVGLQHYTYNGTSWVLKNATADLYNARMKKVAIHYFLAQKDREGGQPTWKSLQLPSLVTAKVISSQPVKNAVNWILLQATHSEGDADLFGKVTYIQRLYTQNGLAPTCAGDKINATYSSPYNAFYVYYRKL